MKLLSAVVAVTCLGLTPVVSATEPVPHGTVVQTQAAAALTNPGYKSSAPTGTEAETALFADGSWNGASSATRLGGANRYSTSVEVAKQFSEGVQVAFVASGADFSDALAAGPAAGLSAAPVLLTQRNQLPSAVEAEIRRLDPREIVIVGGSGVVGSAVEKRLATIAPTSRIWGVDRYATSREVALKLFPEDTSHAILATGRTFPDALSAAPAATAVAAPVILVDGKRAAVPEATLSALEELGVTDIGVAGGPGSVSETTVNQLREAGYNINRHSGNDRYGTSAAINRAYFADSAPSSHVVATGVDFPDAISGSPLAGVLGVPLMLSSTTCIPPVVADSVATLDGRRFIVGGPAVLTAQVATGGRCQYPVKNPSLENWATSDFQFRTDVSAPYADRAPVDVHSPSIKLDQDGVRIYTYAPTGQSMFHPVSLAQYGISALMEFDKTGKQIWLSRAAAQGQAPSKRFQPT